MKGVQISLMCAGLALAFALPASAKCYSFGVWSKEEYCFPDASETDSDIIISTAPEQLDQPFLDVLQSFAQLTGTASSYLALPAASDTDELDRRITAFFAAAHRENDYVVQAVERLDALIAGINRDIAAITAYLQANTDNAAELADERAKAEAEYIARVAEKERWLARVARLRAAADDFSLGARYSRQAVLDLISAAAPADALLITPAMIDNAESLRRSFPPPDELLPLCCDPAPPAAAEVEADWRPVDRELNIDLYASRDAKISSLRQLSGAMQQNIARMDGLAEEKQVKMAELTSLVSRRDALDSELFRLRTGIQGFVNGAGHAAQEAGNAKRDSLDARDKMVLSALQEWVWNSARDNVVVPEIAAFLKANGFDQVAGKLDSSGILEVIEDIRAINWSDAAGIRDLDEFVAVQEKVTALLAPTQSAILQSAEINAWATPAEGEKFARGIFERLGDDAVEFFQAAGQVNVDEHYSGVLRSLLGDMGPRRTAEEL